MIRPLTNAACERIRAQHKHLAHAEHIGVAAYATAELFELHMLMLLVSALIAGSAWLIILFRAEA